jgi:hypothetical protein
MIGSDGEAIVDKVWKGPSGSTCAGRRGSGKDNPKPKDHSRRKALGTTIDDNPT